MTITYRKGTISDSQSVFHVFFKSIMDYSERMNVMAVMGGDDTEVLQSLWERRKSLFEFLAQTASEFWVAEWDGEIIGYARSVEHDGLQELTEFFVLPGRQSGGVGGGLLSRAFPKTEARYRAIIATLDERALHRYMKAGVYGRFLLKYFHRKAEKVEVETDLVVEPMLVNIHMSDLNRIDRKILGHARGIIHEWIGAMRNGFVYKRNEEVVGYGYIGSNNGPFAVLDENDLPAALAHAESLNAEKGDDFGAVTPLINRKAIRYFIERNYRMDAFSALFMSNAPFGKFENYLCFSPEFFL
jgi:GNAT superfamily N-acetyltransferase